MISRLSSHFGRFAKAFGLMALLGACTPFPEVDSAMPANPGPAPKLLPLEQVLGPQKTVQNVDPGDALAARAAALKARAAALRQASAE